MSTYEYSPSTAKAFALDDRIHLPRFQRKITWDASRDFVLAVSVFKGYPLGVVVLNETTSPETGLIKWLLDGRQRRTAFIHMLENPENVYDWARKFLKIKKADTEAEIIEKFWQKIREQLGSDVEASETPSDAEGTVVVDQDADGDAQQVDQVDESTPSEVLAQKPVLTCGDKTMGHLDELLEIILSVHPKQVVASNFSRPFYFKKIAEHLDYVDGKRLSGKELTKLLSGYAKSHPLASEWSPDSFADYVVAEYRLRKKEDVAKILKTLVSQNWSLIRTRIGVVMKISNRLEMAKIGLVSLHAATHRDAQYTFKIINTQGVPLSAAEVSSADPYWNIKVANPSAKLIASSKSFYESIGIKPSTDFVRWDSPATLLYSLGASGRFAMFNAVSDLSAEKSPGESEDNINYGFKLMSAIHLGSVNRTEISELPRIAAPRINWATAADDLVDEFSEMGKVLLDTSYFSAMKSWELSLKARYGDTPSICVATLLYKDWLRKDRPASRGSKKHNQFSKNAFFEFDRLAFESISKKWKSASDTVLSDKLKQFDTSGPELFTPVDEGEWNRLLVEMFDQHSVGGVSIGQKPLSGVFEVFLGHFVCVMGLSVEPQDKPAGFSVDHVVPQSVFEASPRKLEGIRLGNLVPVPKRLNSIKNNKIISKMPEADSRRYANYSSLDHSTLLTFTDCNNMAEIAALLRPIYIEKFLAKRRELIDR
jgi:hypothetical protein